MNEQFCQSCGMPMPTEDLSGTNADHSKNEDYCTYCFQNGKFTSDVTMDEMIETCLNYLDEFNKNSETQYTVEESRTMMKEFFPTLKRWKK